MDPKTVVPASSETTEEYKKILKDNGILDEVSEILVEQNPEALKGAGMTGLPSYVTVKFSDSAVKDLHLFVKREPGHSKSELHESMKLFEKESRFFTEYVPAVKEFCKRKGQENLVNFYPKCYYGDKGVLIFENLAEQGYIQLNKKERQGLESSILAFKTLAKHHIISWAFIKDIGGSEEFFKRFPNLNFEAFEMEAVKALVAPLVENGIATNIKILEKNNVEGKEAAIAKLKEHKGKGYQMLMNAIRHRPEDEKILTLNHGDYWNNNMMFLRDPTTNKLHGHVIFDFQVTRYNSPALDVGNFMYTSMKPEIRRNNRQELLQAYFDTMIDTAKKLGFPLEMSYNEFLQLFQRKVHYGFWFAIWLAADVGYAVINDVEQRLEDGGSDWADRFDEAVQKWVEENPEKSMEDAKGLVELMKEYESFLV